MFLKKCFPVKVVDKVGTYNFDRNDRNLNRKEILHETYISQEIKDLFQPQAEFFFYLLPPARATVINSPLPVG